MEGVAGELADVLREIMYEHASCTESPVAATLLNGWPYALSRFGAIVPRDYRRVLDATRRARAAGEDVDVAVMAAARG